MSALRHVYVSVRPGSRCGALALIATLLATPGCSRGHEAAVEDDAVLTSSVIERGRGCDSCTLELTRLGTLGSGADTVLMTLETMVSQRADGKFVVGPTRQVGEAGIFDSIGAVARPFGRVGEGPGESGRILNVLPWPGDSVMLAGFDRLIVLGPEGRGRTIRLERTSASHRTTVLPADGIVVRNYSYPPDRQFVAFNNDGSIRAEMGYTWKSGYRGDGYEADGQLGPAQRAHAFWSGSQRYRIRAKLWDARDGTLLRTLRFDEPWFTPYDSAALTRFIFAGNDEVNPPPPFMRGIRESADSVLWMLYNIPARNWAPVDDTLPPLQRQWRRAAYDGVINLVDPASGQVLLATWTNVPLTYIVNDSLLVDRRVTDDGFLVFDVYKVKFRRH